MSDWQYRPADATDGNYVNRVQLTWSAVNGATVYRVFRCKDGDQTCGLLIGFPKTDTFNDTKGKPGTVYYYRLRACKTNKGSDFSVSDQGHRGIKTHL